MANLKVNIICVRQARFRRVPLPAPGPDGEWPHPALLRRPGRETGAPPRGVYYLQFRENGKLQYEKLSGDPAEMLAAQCRKETLLQATADGLVA